VYLGLRKDEFNAIDKEFILSLFGKDKNKSKKGYMKLVFRAKTILLDNITKVCFS
jgi:hypothetical protein